MNLYKIKTEHFAPKDSHESMMGFVFANNDEEVYHFVDKQFNHDSWEEEKSDAWEEEKAEFPEYYEDYAGTYKQKIIKLKGEIEDESVEFDDVYYGITLYGWELVDENTHLNYDDLKHLKEFYISNKNRENK